MATVKEVKQLGVGFILIGVGLVIIGAASIQMTTTTPLILKGWITIIAGLLLALIGAFKLGQVRQVH